MRISQAMLRAEQAECRRLAQLVRSLGGALPLPANGYTGVWSRSRFDALLEVHGVARTGRAIADFMTAARRRRDPHLPPVEARVARRWIADDPDRWQDPSKASAGRRPFVFEIALAFGVEPSWLMTGEGVEP